MLRNRVVLQLIAISFLYTALPEYCSAGSTPAPAANPKADEKTKDDLFKQFLKQSVNDNGKLTTYLKNCDRQADFLNARAVNLSLSKEERDKAASDLKALNDRRSRAITNMSTTGEIIAYSLAGDKNSRRLDEDVITSIHEGIIKGCQARTAEVAGDFVGSQIKSLFENLGGPIVKWFMIKVADWVNDADSKFLHNGKKPFEVAKLRGWAAIIDEAFANIANILTESTGYYTRGLDQSSRPFDNENDEQDKATENKITDVWCSLSEVYAGQFGIFIERIREAEKYYKPEDSEEDNSEEDNNDEDGNDVVIFYAENICDVLSVMVGLLKESTSFKDFNNKISSNKAFIVAMRNQIKKYFESLVAEVSNRSYSLKDKLMPQTASNGGNNYRNDSSFSPGSFN